MPIAREKLTDDWPDDDNEYDDQSECCPECSGNRTVPCHCGGDLCFCANAGKADCPVCHGEGVVSPERAERYRENQRKYAEVLAASLKDAGRSKLSEERK